MLANPMDQVTILFITHALPKNLQVDEIVRIEGTSIPSLTSSSVPLRDPLASS